MNVEIAIASSHDFVVAIKKYGKIKGWNVLVIFHCQNQHIYLGQVDDIRERN